MKILWNFLGYMAAYVPMVILLREAKLPPAQILAGSSLGCLIAMIVIWTAKGWWRHFKPFVPRAERALPPPDEAGPFRSPARARVEHFSSPPGRFSALSPLGRILHCHPSSSAPTPSFRERLHTMDDAVGSGIATIGIIVTTTVGLALMGNSAVFMSVMMKAGTLIMAPIIDHLTKRTIRPASRYALALALAASMTALVGKDLHATLQAAIITIAYLACYAVKLRRAANRKGDITFLITDQTIAVSGVLLGVALGSMFNAELRAGFTVMLGRWDVWAIGALSQTTGVFGCLMFLAPEESTFCVPLNRSGSVLASLTGEELRAAFHGTAGVHPMELVAAALIVAAVAALTFPARAARAALARAWRAWTAPPDQALYMAPDAQLEPPRAGWPALPPAPLAGVEFRAS